MTLIKSTAVSKLIALFEVPFNEERGVLHILECPTDIDANTESLVTSVTSLTSYQEADSILQKLGLQRENSGMEGPAWNKHKRKIYTQPCTWVNMRWQYVQSFVSIKR